MEPTYLTPPELAERYRGSITVKTLANWRWLGLGPRFTKIGGRILYALSDVVSWEAANRSTTPTEKAAC
jgi:hypothetical protein